MSLGQQYRCCPSISYEKGLLITPKLPINTQNKTSFLHIDHFCRFEVLFQFALYQTFRQKKRHSLIDDEI